MGGGSTKEGLRLVNDTLRQGDEKELKTELKQDPKSNLNFETGTIWNADNLDLMRGMNSETVDLIYLDPPYNSERIYKGKIPNQEFGDVWRKDILKKYEIDLLEIDYPETNKILESVKVTHSEGMFYYLVFMFIRLFEMYRILKPTGSIFLHCDKHANAYIRMLLDAVFGKNNLINEIVWCYTGPGNVKRRMPQKHDTIFAYSKSQNYTFHSPRVPYKDNLQIGTSGIFGDLHEDRSKAEQMRQERLKMGKRVEDWWSDIGSGGNIPRHELTGWSTQKPRKLLDRIIRIATRAFFVQIVSIQGFFYQQQGRTGRRKRTTCSENALMKMT